MKFFASLREQVGVTDQQIALDGPSTVQQVWDQVVGTPPPPNCLCSRNQQYAEWDEQVESGDEVAFFPPVTGG